VPCLSLPQKLPAISALDAETATAIIRVTAGNFRLLAIPLSPLADAIAISEFVEHSA
jgi:hypothetical protein